MEAATSAKSSRASRKSRGSAVALKKIAHELHHAPGLVGGIVEKGFSSSSSGGGGGGGSGNSSTVPLPRPAVLPFPVARHRSHGPHWAPVGAASVEAEDDGMEEDKDETDYDPIASFANPVERKKKKSLDFSRWKDFVTRDDASVPQSKKKEAKNEAENTREVKRSGLVNGDNKEQSPSAYLGGVDMASSEEMMRTELTNRSFSADLSTMAEPKFLVEKLEPEAAGANGSNSGTAVNGISARAEKSAEICDVEMTEDTDHGSSSFMDDIDAENLSRLKQMSAEEIAEAQAEIMEKMDPAIIEMLKKRGQNKSRNKKGIEQEQKLRSRKDIDQDQDKGRQELVSSMAVESVNSATAMTPPGDWISKTETNNSSWKAWSERVEKVRSLSFSLDGNVVETDSTQYVLNGHKPGPYRVENVAERDLLRTEGDPAAIGYTINEAVALTRSMIPGQRAIALQLLGSVLSKTLYNLKQMDNDCHIRETNAIDNYVDWQAVWAFALGPEPQVALSLRIALDDNHDSVVLACVKAILSILSFEINENFFDNSEKVTSSKKNTFTAPVFRSRPEIDRGFLHGGYWKYSAKPSNILPSDHQNNEDDESEGKSTIQDDITVAGQDVAAGLVRMGILPRICYLLEMDPLPVLEESLVSIVVAVARHSSTSADAVMKCPNLIQTVVKIFTKQGLERYSSQIKAILLLKVLSQARKQICFDFVKRGVFQQAMWHWYKNVFTLESWIQCGPEYCKLTSALMVEQLRLWKVCIQYGFCLTYLADFFPAMCLWLGPPMFEKLIGKNILGEFTSITREAYLVLEALAQKLPALHSPEQINKQEIGFADNTAESWSWNHVPPMIDLAVSWLSFRDIPYLSSLTAQPKKKMSDVEVASLACILWVISAILHMLCSIFDRVAPTIHNELDNKRTTLPWLPYFVPKVGLKIIKNGFLDFLCLRKFECEACPTESGSFASLLCFFRQQGNFDVSLSSVSCLQGLVQLALLVDDCVQRAKSINNSQPRTESKSRLPEKILEEGIVRSAQNELSQVLTLFMGIVSSEWQVLQSDMFGRGGPAPGIGFGWASCGGGFWSLNVLLAQTDVQLTLNLLEVIPVASEDSITRVEALKPVVGRPEGTLQRINSLLSVCLLAGPGDEATLGKAWDHLFQALVLKYLSSCVNHYLCHIKSSTSDFQYGEEDYYCFSKILNSHYRERWLSAKKKTISEVDKNDMHKKSHALETIHEEIEPNTVILRDQSRNALLVEWAHQRLPLPTHWFLSAICVVGDFKRIGTHSPTDLDVAKGGLFFLLGLEVMSSFLCSISKESLISGIPLVWKLHALSMALSQNMDVLSEDRSRTVFLSLQDLYGQRISQLKCGGVTNKDEKVQDSLVSSSEAQVSGSLGVLSFQTTIHESYDTFVDNIVEQFGAISYGDIIYARQVAVYLHRTVEPTIRLAVWKALTNVCALELLPPLEKCIADAEGYLEPVEDKEEILEAYAKSLISGDLDRAATRGSLGFTLATHHLSCFLFSTSTLDKLAMRKKLVKLLLRSHLQKKHNEAMLLNLIRYGLTSSEGATYKLEVAKRLALLEEACEGNSTLLAVVEILKSLV